MINRLRNKLRWRIRKRFQATPARGSLRKVMNADSHRVFEALNPSSLHVAEISGAYWTGLPWASREQLNFPEFDLCNPPPQLPGPFDLVICEQVLEHVPDPITAVSTLRKLCKSGGHVFVSTPFLVRLHGAPNDYWRYTPDGMKLLLRSQGLEPLWVRTWGNRKTILANFDYWMRPLPWLSERDEPNLPAMVWALAQPQKTNAATAGR
jgi:SAM-dependent methyltransferase